MNLKRTELNARRQEAEGLFGQFETYARHHAEARAAHTAADERYYAKLVRGLVPPCFALNMVDAVSGTGLHAEPMRVGCLGIAEHTETREFFALVLYPDGARVLVPLRDFLKPEDRSSRKGITLHYRGPAFILGERASYDALFRAFPNEGNVSAGLLKHFKSTDRAMKQYACFGDAVVAGSGEPCVVYMALYEPHARELAFRPFHYQSADTKKKAGFYDDPELPSAAKVPRFSFVKKMPVAHVYRELVAPLGMR